MNFPLSFAQQRLWFIDQLVPNSALYNIPLSMPLKGEIDRNTLQIALNKLIERHEVLRTVFKAIEGTPYQVIQEHLELDLPLIDISLLEEKEKTAKVKECIEKDPLIPFNLTEGPLIRASLIKIEEQKHIFLLTIHHIVTDGWSFGVIYEDLSELYNATLEKREAHLPSLSVQYIDFSVWQREYLKEEGETYKKLLSYWAGELQGAPPLLALPTDHPRPSTQSYKGNHRSISLSSELTKKLKELSEETQTTLFMILLAAFYTLLYRYTNQEDMVVGSPIANRNRQEIEHLVGFFVNTLALRVTLSPDLSFRELLSQVKRKTLGAYDHQDLPFEKLVERLGIERSLAHESIFQVMFVLQNAAENAELKLKGLKAEEFFFEHPSSAFDLTLSLIEVGGQLQGSFEYAADLFKPSTIERMQKHFQKLLEEIVNNPNKSLSQLEILAAEEKQQILVTWNDTQTEYPKDKTIHQLFEEQVTKTPNNIAVIFENQHLTYQELNTKANQLAHALRERGVQPDTLVAIACERSLEMIIGILGILKAGGAYVPIDPSYPQERIRFILEDTKAPLLLTQSFIVEHLPQTQAEIIQLDKEKLENYPTTNPLCLTQPHHLAYVIYTSGSTGQPKGVMIEHKSIGARLAFWQTSYPLKKDDVFLQQASISFDASVEEIFWPLSNGLLVVFAYPSKYVQVADLVTLISSYKITFLQCAPSLLKAFLEQPNLEKLSSLRKVFVGGEALHHELKEEFLRKLPNAELKNSYGPTETTVDAMIFPCTASEKSCFNQFVPIGRAISNTEGYILDTFLNPVPVGVVGELYIGGDGLARGYLNQPELTAEKFIKNPFQTEERKIQGKNGRLYKTGDMCRWLEDGNIEYIGRNDDQIKIRGFRIELGEIEAVLLQHFQIKEAIVVAREDTLGDKRLVGYLIFKKNADNNQEIVEISELRAHLQTTLPDYMIPSAFVVLETIPLTTNGKVDRKGLPAPEYQGDEKFYVMPKTATEKALCEIWQHVLKIEKVGIHDNFFTLGGHSLLATQVVSRLRSQHGIDVSLRDFFKNANIEALGQAVEGSPKEIREETLPLVIVERTGRIPLSFAQQRLWFIDQLESNSALYNIPSVLKLEGFFEQNALQSALNKLTERHEVLRTVFKIEEGQPYQVIREKLEPDLPLIDVSLLKGKEKEDRVKECIQEETLAPFSLGDGPLIRAAIIKLKEQEHIFLLTLHHSISDEWSFGLIYEELSELYNAALEKQKPDLASLPVQYADFSVWQREYLKEEGETHKELLNYWVSELKGAPALLELPTDHLRPPIQSYKGNYTSFSLSSDLTKKLKELSEAAETTLFMTLLASFYALLYRYTNQEDMVVGLPIAGRNRQEIEHLVGFFVNTLALRVNFLPDLSFKDLLSQVKQKTLGAYDHQDLPFEKLVEHLRVERSLAHGPLFQVMFDLQNAAENVALKLKGLKVEEVSFEYPIAKFDLSLSLVEVEGQLQGSFEYATDLFKLSTIERMQEHFHKLLEEIVKNSNRSLFYLEMLPSEEKQQILLTWNGTEKDYPKDKTIHQLFEEQVAKTPSNIAVVFGDQQLTYQELNIKANQLAHYLRELQVGPEQLVAICLEKSLDTVISLLAVWKAGGAYVPLDPDYPQERLEFMLENTQPPVLLTLSHLKDMFPNYSGQLVFLDFVNTEGCSKSNPLPSSLSSHLAYVIYTSGSTGTPKGVMIEHTSLCKAHYSWCEAYHLESLSSYLQMASFSFDVFVGDIIRALYAGVKLVLCPRSILLDPISLYQLLKKEKIECAEFVPSVIRSLIEHMTQLNVTLETFKVLIVGSDQWSVEEYQQLRNFLPSSARLLNSFGVTEATIDSTFFETPHSLTGTHFNLLPIGRPFSNTKIYILDKYGQLVPIGISGELYIGGDGLARGYLNRPDLTAERFIENPFQTKEEKVQGKNARLYKTGDLCRWLEDGNIEYIGRIDDQVKIRGFRIELGEIEAALLQHVQIKAAVVIVREDAPGDKRLVGYLVFKDKDQEIVEVSELRAHLSSILPDYMIPSAFVTVKGIPLTTNGKVDRKGLPAPEYQGDEKSYVAPRTETEKTLCEIWQSVLKIGKVGIHDNFFALGGHSLLATQVVSRLRSQYGIEVSLRDFFKNSTVEALGRAVEGSPRETREEALPLVVVERTGRIPLSFAQQRLWFIDQLESNSALYNIPVALKLEGPLDKGALQSALKKLIERHEALRTVFKTEEGKPYQVIQEHLESHLFFIDVSLLKGKEKEDKVKECIQEEALAPFSLADGPLIRAALIKFKEQEHIFLLTFHHSISDEWSFGIIYEELSEFYNTAVEKKEPQLASLPVQYADFSVWQREYLKEEGKTYKNLISYWVGELKGAPTLLELPTDHPRPPVQSYRGNLVSFFLSPDLTKKLKELSEETQTTLFMTVLASFYALLYRYTNQDDMVVGLPIAGRNRQEIEHLVGFFVNMLPLRVKFSKDLSFRDLLFQVKQKTLGAYDHQDLPFEKLVEHLRIERSLAHEPLFQVMFDLQNASENMELKLKNLKTEEVSFDYPIAKFDLSLSLIEIEGQLHGTFEYATDLFRPATIERMQKHFRNLLEEIVNNPNKSLSQLEMLAAEEKQQILLTWNDTQTEYPKDKTIQQLFEEQVIKTPNNIAVILEEQQLTYQELNKKANQLAHYLRAQGVKPDTLVAIAVERSLEMVIGILGILKAGGAYVPIDPSYPQERIQFMLEDAGARLLLSQQVNFEKLPTTNTDVFLLDKNKEKLKSYSIANPSHTAQSHHLAHVIYTSGSTGRPKGVLSIHQGVVNRLLWMKDYCKLTEEDCILQKTPYTFDVSVWELLLGFLGGARLVFTKPEGHKDPYHLSEIIRQKNVTLMHFVPSMLEAFLACNEARNFPNLKRVITSGETLSFSLKDRFFKKFPDTELHNFYGPTEASIDVTFWNCSSVNHPEIVPIGKPIWNTSLYILNSFLKPVSIGVSGELYIGGDGLARGYLNRPELTAEKFIENPFQTEEEEKQGKNGRLYKTGDLCRWLEDGNIEYIGRSDDQVKIRGFRIELGEIEAALLQHVQVKEAVVIAREDTPGDKRLVGYLVFKADQDKAQGTVVVSELRTHLLATLPDYMIPSAFVTMEAIPLTANGKMDRKGLPAPEYQGNEKAYVAPRTEMEKTLCEIWQSVLKVEKVGIHDNFFQVGGDSIMSIQLVAKARQREIYISVREIFSHPTVAGLVSIAQTQENVLKIKPKQGLVEGEVDLTPIQHWFFEQNFVDYHHFNQAMLLEAKQRIDHSLLNKALTLLVEHHDALRLRYSREEQGWCQAYVKYQEEEICEILNLSGKEDLDKEIDRESTRIQQSFNIEKGPVIKAGLFECGEGRAQRILIAVHHLMIDGVSWRILLEDLERIYSQLAQGGKPTFFPKTHSYQQWAQALKEYASSQDLLKEAPYWKKIEEYVRPLPIDFNKSTEDESKFFLSTFTISFTAQETNALLSQVPKAYRTQINDILLTALVFAVGDWTGNYELSLNLEGHGREDIIQDIDLSRTVGWFTSIFSVHLKIENDQDIEEGIKSVKETLRGIPHKGIGYGILRYLRKDKLREVSAYTCPSLGFNYLGQWDNTLVKEGLFTFGEESSGQSVSTRNHLHQLIDVNSEVSEDVLQMNWTYNNHYYEEKTIKNLAYGFRKRLQQLINHCTQDHNFGYTPSDFELVEITDVDLAIRMINEG